MKVLTDFHHSGLLKSTQLLFENRLGMELYRPIGLEWFENGFWSVWPHPATAEQYLGFDQTFKPSDGTPQLNQIAGEPEPGVFMCQHPGEPLFNKACTLEYFKTHKFDYVIASMPQHIEPYQRLIREHMPEAKLIFQVGNHDWHFENLNGMNVLASVAPREVSGGTNALFYHQEVDLEQFYATPVEANGNVYSFVNLMQDNSAWPDFLALEEMSSGNGTAWRAFGGQCRDGSMSGDIDLANKMREAMVICHLKPSGDGFGHVIHDAYAVGRPVITRSSYNKGKLAEFLLVPGTFIDLDAISLQDCKTAINRLLHSPELLQEMGRACRERFDQIVNYDEEAEAIKQWLTNLY